MFLLPVHQRPDVEASLSVAFSKNLRPEGIVQFFQTQKDRMMPTWSNYSRCVVRRIGERDNQHKQIISHRSEPTSWVGFLGYILTRQKRKLTSKYLRQDSWTLPQRSPDPACPESVRCSQWPPTQDTESLHKLPSKVHGDFCVTHKPIKPAWVDTETDENSRAAQ